MTWCCGPVRDFAPLAWVAEFILDMVDDGNATATPGPSKPLRDPRPHSSLSMASSPELGGRSTAVSAPVVSAPAPTAPAPIASAPQRTGAHRTGVHHTAIHHTGIRRTGARRSAAAAAALGHTTAHAARCGESSEPTRPGRDVPPENEGPWAEERARSRLPKEIGRNRLPPAVRQHNRSRRVPKRRQHIRRV